MTLSKIITIMKNKFLFLLFTSILLGGCSSDDNSEGNPPTQEQGIFFPQQQGNYWVYDVNSTQGEGRDSLYISGIHTNNEQTYYTFSTQSNPPFGFYSSMMVSGESRTSDSKVYISGSISMADIFGGEFTDYTIDFQDFLFFDTGASQGQTLDSNSGEFEIPYSEEMTFSVQYTLSAKVGQNYSDYTTPSGDIYEDVNSVVIAVSAKITANINFFGTIIPYPLLNTQDVISSTQYYANNIGMMFATTDFQYNLNEIDGFAMPIPKTYFSNTTEELDHYLTE